jgi:hypothetical protein
MTTKKLVLILGIGAISQLMLGQAAKTQMPYSLKHSEEYKSPRGHRLIDCEGYGKEGTIQFSCKRLKSFAFQQFTEDLKLKKENISELNGRIPKDDEMMYLAHVNTKTYLLTRNDGVISYLEFFPDKLDFAAKSNVLFKTSDEIRGGVSMMQSRDSSKVMFYYSLKPKIKRDILSKEIIGVQVFDYKLGKLWGAEYEMPYSEAKMDILDYTLSNDGKVYLSTKVFKNDNRKEKTKDGEANYNFEIFALQKDSKKPKTMTISVDNKFPSSATIFEDHQHNIVIAGFYSKEARGSVEGAYTVRVGVEGDKLVKLNGGYYEIPNEVIKQNESLRTQKKVDKKAAKGKDVGLRDMEIRSILTMPNGSVKIVAENYYIIETTHSNGKTTTTTYTTYAEEVYVFSIDAKGSMEWIKKLPKLQRSGGAIGPAVSINILPVGDNIHIFYLDDKENDKILKTNAPPHTYGAHRGGCLIGIAIDPKGNVSRYNLGDVKEYKTNFFIRYFSNGGKNNLISTERRRRKNILFSLQVK